MPSLRRIEVEGLFGLYDHSITLRDDPPVTIVAGPNGIGKTTLLSLTKSLLQGSYREVIKHQFTRLSVSASNGSRLEAAPVPREGEGVAGLLDLTLYEDGAETATDRLSVPAIPDDFTWQQFVNQQHLKDFYFERAAGEHAIPDDKVTLYGGRAATLPSVDPPEWYEPSAWAIDFIETKRLDTLVARSHAAPGSDPRPGAPIDFYLSAVRDALERARSESTRIRQTLDRSFARRLLTKGSRTTVNEGQLRARYSEVEERAGRLTANGLLEDSLDVLPRQKLNPTEKRIVKLFLDDFEAKLAPLTPVSTRLDQLRSIIGNKFLNKHLTIDADEGVVFFAEPDDHRIEPEALSSGEQHELALVSKLLFTEDHDTTVVIDEPELSLHVSWQHEMIDDLVEIANVSQLSFVLATHSTAIINGRWELVEELGPLVDAADEA